MSDHLLEVRNLTTVFESARGPVQAMRRIEPTRVRAVDDVTFTVDSGELVALVGESGSGKTTTAQSLLQMLPRTSGEVLFKGIDLATLPSRQMREMRRKVQVVYQDPYESLDPRYTVRRTIEEPLLIHGIGGTKQARRDIILAALERVGLTPPDLFLDRYQHQLSGGQRQRVSIATALTLEPELLIADEPVSMLDVSVRAGILELLDELRDSGLGILMITHDLSTAAKYADRIAVMYLGRIVEFGSARDVTRDARHPYTQALLSVVPTPARAGMKRMVLTGETPNAAHIPAGCRFHPRCPMAADACQDTDPQLAEVPGGPIGHDAACVRLAELAVDTTA
jgi:oligopeptide/dipeptide ABC transporter ATP-binding protein